MRQDYEYKREGTANIFMTVEPLAGKRRVRVTDRRTGRALRPCLHNHERVLNVRRLPIGV